MMPSIIGYEYDQGVYGVHPKTNEPIYPPIVLTAMCDERSIGWVRSTLVRLNESRGWTGDYFERPLYEGVADGK